MVSGLFLGSGEEVFLARPALLFVTPIFINTVGDLASILASRITSGLALGTISEKLGDPVLRKNLRLQVGVGLVLSLVTGAIGLGVDYAMGGGSLLVFAVISLASAVSVVIMCLFSIPVAVLTHRKGWDPDNIAASVLSTCGDLTGIGVLVLLARLLLG